ncbi:MAG: PH domain-containing protein [Methanoregulaceae archaeon]
MSPDPDFTIGKPFRPAESFVRWFQIDYLILILFLVLVAFLPAASASEMNGLVIGVIGALIIIVSIIFLVWTRLYYESMVYELRVDEITWKRGVWFRRTGIVPYNRITNLDLVQGPVMRYLGISTLAIQTAGYSGQAVPEIRIEAIEKAEELRELIRDRVRKSCRSDDGTGNHPGTSPAVQAAGSDERILQELVAIRTILEGRKI